MWSAISRLLGKSKSEETSPSSEDQKCNISNVPEANEAVHVFDKMDRNTAAERRKGLCDYPVGGGDSEHHPDYYDSRQVKEFYIIIHI